MFNIYKFLILIFLGFTFNSKCTERELASKEVNITIFVHGTRTLMKLFPGTYVPAGLVKVNDLDSKSYIRSIANTLSDICPKDYCKERFYAFGWSGNLNPKARELAGQELAKCIKKLISDFRSKSITPKITIITHSHGGNVVLNLAKLQNIDFNIDRLILLACPVQHSTKDLIKNNIFKNIYSIYSSLDMLQVLDPQGLHQGNKNKNDCPFFSERLFEDQNNLKQAKIKINERAIMHVEFITQKFAKILPEILKNMDNSNFCSGGFLKIPSKL